MVEYLIMNVPLNGSTADIQSTAREVYNEVLDITPITPEPNPAPVGSPRRTRRGSPRRSGTRGRLRNGVGPAQPNLGNPIAQAPTNQAGATNRGNQSDSFQGGAEFAT